jgi:hypothetical protein
VAGDTREPLSRCLSRRFPPRRQRSALRWDRRSHRLRCAMTGPLVRLSAWRARRRARLDAEAARAERPDGGIGAEAPIRTASEDRLRRADFAGRIAGVLSELSLREGRVFAIRGEWGFGKSSLKNLITERLDARSDGADWLDFNPWQWGDGHAIARALFGQIADRLGGEQSKAAARPRRIAATVRRDPYRCQRAA